MKMKTEVVRFDVSVIHVTIEDFCGLQEPVSSAIAAQKGALLRQKGSHIRILRDMDCRCKLSTCERTD
jgi:hypothetical protein